MSKSVKSNIGDEPQPDPQVEKLKLEIADLKWKVKWVSRVAQVVSIVSAVIAVVAFLIGLRQFYEQQKQFYDQQEQEVKKPVKERQLQLVFELSDVASKIATLKPGDADRQKAEARFRQLYWGPIVYVEDKELQQWILDFDNCLAEYARLQTVVDEADGDAKPAGCGSAEQQEKRLRQLSLSLAAMRRIKLDKEWDLNSLNDIYETRAKNNPTPLSLP